MALTPDQQRRMRMRRMNLLMGYAALSAKSSEPPSPPPTPGGASDVLLLSNGTDGLLLVDGASFLKLASSS